MTPNMINWPTDSDLYGDTGEGGLFAWLVVLAPENPDDPCTVDTHAMITEPDVRVPYREAKPRLWGSTNYQDRARTKLHAARAALEHADERGVAKALEGLRGEDELSVALRWAGFLGATSASLVHDRLGGYFQATPADLTPTGNAIYDALATEYGPENVHIITFLDT